MMEDNSFKKAINERIKIAKANTSPTDQNEYVLGVDENGNVYVSKQISAKRKRTFSYRKIQRTVKNRR